ncbi:MAG: hypothetical protein U9Q58_11395 [Pseudomonadota bacterium]|nr:hypothetical protein [Pseudomonadota bacterium]
MNYSMPDKKNVPTNEDSDKREWLFHLGLLLGAVWLLFDGNFQRK